MKSIQVVSIRRSGGDEAKDKAIQSRDCMTDGYSGDFQREDRRWQEGELEQTIVRIKRGNSVNCRCRRG